MYLFKELQTNLDGSRVYINSATGSEYPIVANTPGMIKWGSGEPNSEFFTVLIIYINGKNIVFPRFGRVSDNNPASMLGWL